MVERAAAMREAWREGAEIDISAEMMRLSLEVVARTLFAQEVTEDILSINHEVNAIMKLYNFLIALPRAEDYLHLPIPGLMRFRRARKRLDEVVYRMIAEHRAAGVDRGDLLSMLLRARDDEQDHSGMSDEQIRDEVLTIFLAGYETVANALSWTWMLLGQNPEAEAKLHEELDRVLEGRLPTLDDLPQLSYTEMVLAESMRLYPPAWAMGRQATRDVAMGPYLLPAGTYFFFSQYIIQRSAEHYPDPLRFDPERFTPENKARTVEICLLPFRCGQPAVYRRVVCVDGGYTGAGDAGAALAAAADSGTETGSTAEDYSASEVWHSDGTEASRGCFLKDACAGNPIF